MDNSSMRARAVEAATIFFAAKNPTGAFILQTAPMQATLGRLVDLILEAAALDSEASGLSAVEKAAQDFVDDARDRYPGQNFTNPFALKLMAAIDAMREKDESQDPELTISLGDAECALRSPQMVGAVEGEFVDAKLTALKFKSDCAVLHIGKGVRIFEGGKTYRVVADDNCQHNCQHHPVLDAIFPGIQPKN